jgi:hypothetical protein
MTWLDDGIEQRLLLARVHNRIVSELGSTISTPSSDEFEDSEEEASLLNARPTDLWGETESTTWTDVASGQDDFDRLSESSGEEYASTTSEINVEEIAEQVVETLVDEVEQSARGLREYVVPDRGDAESWEGFVSFYFDHPDEYESDGYDYNSWFEHIQSNSKLSWIYAAISQCLLKRNITDEETIDKIRSSLVNLMECAGMIAYSMNRATCPGDVVMALITGYKLITQRNVSTDAVDVVAHILKFARKYFGGLSWKNPIAGIFGGDESDDDDDTPLGNQNMTRVHLQSEPLLEGETSFAKFSSFTKMFRRMVTDWKSVANSKLAKKIRQIIVNVVAMGWMKASNLPNVLSFSDFEITAAKEKVSDVSFVFSVFDGVSYFLERMVQSAKMGSFQPFFHSESTYAAWADKAQKLEHESLKLTNPLATGLDVHKYTKDIAECINEGEFIVKCADDKWEKRLIQSTLFSLKGIQTNLLLKKFAQATRAVPYALLVHGTSSVGKSKFMELLHSTYADAYKKDKSEKFKYTRCWADEFWSGFDSGMWCLILDDIALLNPAKAQEDKSTNIIIPAINGIAFGPPQADLKDKGMTPARFDLVLASTNTKDLNSEIFFSCPLAVLRRFKMIVTLTVKEQYGQEDAKEFLDQEKVQDCDEVWPDYWDITVSRALPSKRVDQAGVHFKEVFKFSNIYDFIEAYITDTRNHWKYQELDAKNTTSLNNVKLCGGCCRPETMCRCIGARLTLDDLSTSQMSEKSVKTDLTESHYDKMDETDELQGWFSRDEDTMTDDVTIEDVKMLFNGEYIRIGGLRREEGESYKGSVLVFSPETRSFSKCTQVLTMEDRWRRQKTVHMQHS